MTNLTPVPGGRPPRLRMANITPAVLRFADGRRAPAELRVVSLTGGLLCLSQPVLNGLQAKVMFLSTAGPVIGAAEMLSPLSTKLQPFRFTGLDQADQRRLQSAINASLALHSDEQLWIEKYRATLAIQEPQKKPLFKALGAVALGAACVFGWRRLRSFRARKKHLSAD
jgi:hypothetical protein